MIFFYQISHFCFSKLELQKIIIKKKQCDAQALLTIEQLLEPNINSDWLLQNVNI